MKPVFKIKFSSYRIFFLLIVLLIFSAISGTNNSSYQSKAKKLQSGIEDYIGDCGDLCFFSSFAIAVVNDTGIIYKYCYNTDPEKRYEIASITKIFTATAIMKLAEEKKIDIDRPASEYLSGFRIERPELNSIPVTVRHLLSHSSGLPDIRYYKPLHYRKYKNLDIPLQIYPAGIHYRYSNHGFMLLGKIIEDVSGMKYGEFVKKKIYVPAGMSFADTTSNPTGANGVLVSLLDMANYAVFWLKAGVSVNNEKVLDASTVKQMLSPQLFIPFAENIQYVGLGWRVHADREGVITFFHIGGAANVSAWIQMFPRQKIAVVYLGDPKKYNSKIFKFITNVQKKLVELATAICDKNELIDKFVPTLPPNRVIEELPGKYKNPIDGEVLKVILSNKRLKVKRGAETTALTPGTTHVFTGGPEALAYDFIFRKDSEKPEALATYFGFFEKLPEEEEK